jgi:hypothetical protein
MTRNDAARTNFCDLNSPIKQKNTSTFLVGVVKFKYLRCLTKKSSGNSPFASPLFSLVAKTQHQFSSSHSFPIQLYIYTGASMIIFAGNHYTLCWFPRRFGALSVVFFPTHATPTHTGQVYVLSLFAAVRTRVERTKSVCGKTLTCQMIILFIVFAPNGITTFTYRLSARVWNL